MFATQQLREEHAEITVMLAVLERLAEEAQQGQPLELAQVAQVLEFLRGYADACHHGKEEELLFPALSAIGVPTQGGPIGVMLADHDQGRLHIRAMGEALASLQAGEVAARAAFIDHAFAYARLLRAHIDKENNVLFMIAEHHLAADAHATLAAAFARVEEERLGAGAHARYEALVKTLEARYLAEAA